MSIELLPEEIRRNYDVEERYHACAILHTDFRAEWDDLIAALQEFRLTRTMVMTRGGRKSPIALWIDDFFYRRHWEEKRFNIQVRVDDATTLSPTHHVDYFRNRVALETEWNNKDPFYDRDLTTFRLLFDLNVLSVGIIITRADELQNIFNALGRGPSYGQSTTHMSRLLGKMNNRASGGCPVLALGIRASLYDENA
ncbi:MAG: BglII/BstYI family type II restriction endonuclease [Terriglobales bacterium]